MLVLQTCCALVFEQPAAPAAASTPPPPPTATAPAHGRKPLIQFRYGDRAAIQAQLDAEASAAPAHQVVVSETPSTTTQAPAAASPASSSTGAAASYTDIKASNMRKVCEPPLLAFLANSDRHRGSVRLWSGTHRVPRHRPPMHFLFLFFSFFCTRLLRPALPSPSPQSHTTTLHKNVTLRNSPHCASAWPPSRRSLSTTLSSELR